MMKLIIEYAYTRTVPITAENVESLLSAADQFNIMGIVRLCCEFLKSQLSLENCIGICRLTNCYHCPNLQQTAYTFILHNFEELVKVSTEFLDLSVDEFKSIIEKDELNVKQEDVVFDAILKWIAHDPDNRKQYISVLLSKVSAAVVPPILPPYVALEMLARFSFLVRAEEIAASQHSSGKSARYVLLRALPRLGRPRPGPFKRTFPHVPSLSLIIPHIQEGLKVTRADIMGRYTKLMGVCRQLHYANSSRS